MLRHIAAALAVAFAVPAAALACEGHQQQASNASQILLAQAEKKPAKKAKKAKKPAPKPTEPKAN